VAIETAMKCEFVASKIKISFASIRGINQSFIRPHQFVLLAVYLQWSHLYRYIFHETDIMTQPLLLHLSQKVIGESIFLCSLAVE